MRSVAEDGQNIPNESTVNCTPGFPSRCSLYQQPMADFKVQKKTIGGPEIVLTFSQSFVLFPRSINCSCGGRQREGAMKKSKRAVRRMIMHSLFLHLSEKYAFSESDVDVDMTIHQLDALLAFKSDLRVEELRSALDRLDDGTYGSCILCKKPIANTALDDDPAIRYCEVCERTYMSASTEEFVTVHQ
jgi:RNA polymerase-binding transcription factor DksA